MKKTILGMALASVAFSGYAVQSEDFALSGGATITSDYRWRGVSQTEEDPALQIGFQVDHSSGVYVGIWGSNVDFGSYDVPVETETDTSGRAIDGYYPKVEYREVEDDADVEIDYYLGYSRPFGESNSWSYDLGALYYTYDGDDNDDFLEFYGSIGNDHLLGDMNGSASLGLAYSYDFAGQDEDNYYGYLDYSVGVHQMLNLDLHVGRTESDLTDDYTDWSVGVSTEYQDFGLSLAYVDTDIDDYNSADETFVIAISRSF